MASVTKCYVFDRQLNGLVAAQGVQSVLEQLVDIAIYTLRDQSADKLVGMDNPVCGKRLSHHTGPHASRENCSRYHPIIET